MTGYVLNGWTRYTMRAIYMYMYMYFYITCDHQVKISYVTTAGVLCLDWNEFQFCYEGLLTLLGSSTDLRT